MLKSHCSNGTEPWRSCTSAGLPAHTRPMRRAISLRDRHSKAPPQTGRVSARSCRGSAMLRRVPAATRGYGRSCPAPHPDSPKRPRTGDPGGTARCRADRAHQRAPCAFLLLRDWTGLAHIRWAGHAICRAAWTQGEHVDRLGLKHRDVDLRARRGTCAVVAHTRRADS